MGQVYIARVKREDQNGAIGWASGGMFDCLGYYAKVQNCPIMVEGCEVARLTAYATGHADTWFSVPACTRYKGKHVRGYFTGTESGTVFQVMASHKHLFLGGAQHGC